MQKDIRDTAAFREAQALYHAIRRPGTGQISDAAELHVSPRGDRAVFVGIFMDQLAGTAPSRICQIDLLLADICVLTFGPHTDRLPKYSPDGEQIAFLSDRHKPGDFQLYLLDPTNGAAEAAARVEGWVEYLHWSPDGKRILLGVAGHGADVSGGQGAVTSKQAAEVMPSWMPTVATADENFRWRRVWVYELATKRVRKVSPPHYNVWEAAWCGNHALAAVVSPGPGEGMWYSARLHVLETETGAERELFQPGHQLGWPAGSPSGRWVAVVEAICSDRWIVAGDLRLIETASASVRHVATRGVDVTYIEWLSDTQLLLAGHRGFETVVGLYDVAADRFTETWASSEVSTVGRYAAVSALPEAGDCVLLGEGFVRAPEIATVRGGEYHAVRSFDLGYADHCKAIGAVERTSWSAPDGLEIQGWVLHPEGSGPHPLIMNVHGGPVSHWRPTWLARRNIQVLMLLNRGYAIFLPNPRGSSGLGQSFARHVLGDMGGNDTQDYLAGLDQLVGRGIADPNRLGVMGGSYGGFMTAWLITQDSRFAAAVALAPITNQVTQHLLSNIPQFVSLFLADSYRNSEGRYFQRSPIMHAHRVRTPTLNVCGALDRCTPPQEAAQFHNALLENGVESVLVTYPEEGHGIRQLPAALDYAARVVQWFDAHLSAKPRKR